MPGTPITAPAGASNCRFQVEAKFRTNLARRFPKQQQDASLALSLDQQKLEATPVHEYVDLYVS
ncbi:hypothetical protein PY257_04310 [Ramlibacter sp. H39-3-26]|nr:hypothetical protein [Ramlibacter sp. H39-3-26]MDF1484409.1 hypothetical protein [Ramlibacter sp. H39-3-26]